MTCSFKYDGKEFATKQQIVDYINSREMSFSTNLGPIIEIDRPLYTAYNDNFVRRSMAASRPLISIRGFLNMELFRLPADHTNRKLVEVLSDKIELSNVLDIKINQFPHSESDSEFRAFYAHGLVYDGIYNPPAIYYPAGMDLDMRGEIILHEIMHAYTEGVLKADPKLLKPEEVKFVKQIDELFKLANGLAIRHNLDFYGLTNKSEFIAEAMTDPEFKQFLKRRKIKLESFNGTLWGYLIQILKELFTAGITEVSLLDLTEKAVFNYLENKSNVIYIRRIDAKSPDFLSVDYSQSIRDPLSHSNEYEKISEEHETRIRINLELTDAEYLEAKSMLKEFLDKKVNEASFKAWLLTVLRTPQDYRRLATVFHPDMNPNIDTTQAAQILNYMWETKSSTNASSRSSTSAQQNSRQQSQDIFAIRLEALKYIKMFGDTPQKTLTKIRSLEDLLAAIQSMTVYDDNRELHSRTIADLNEYIKDNFKNSKTSSKKELETQMRLSKLELGEDTLLSVEDIIYALDHGLFNVGMFINLTKIERLRNQMFTPEQLKVIDAIRTNPEFYKDHSVTSKKVRGLAAIKINWVNLMPGVRGAVPITIGQRTNLHGKQVLANMELADIEISRSYFDQHFIRNNWKLNAFSQLTDTILHELMHRLTVTSLYGRNFKGYSDVGMSPRKELGQEIISAYEYAKEIYESTAIRTPAMDYIMQSPDEFVAEFFNNNAFRDFLRNIKYYETVEYEETVETVEKYTEEQVVKEKVPRTVEIEYSLFDKILSAILKIIFGHTKEVPSTKIVYDTIKKTITVPKERVVTTKQIKTKRVPINNVLDKVEPLIQYIVNTITKGESQRVLFLKEEVVEKYVVNRKSFNQVAYPIESLQFVTYNGEQLFSKAIRDDETKTYKEGSEEYDSVTGKVLPDMQTRPFTSTDDAGTRAANAIWGTEDPSTEKEIRGVTGTLNKEEYIKLVNSRRDKAIAKGTIFHKIFHAYISNDPQVWGEINDLYTESGILKSELEWLDKKMVARILRKTGTNYFDDNPTDKLYTERTFSSSILKWAGTADLFIDHGDNVYSLYDIKTGKLGDDWEQSFLKYGRTSTEDIFDNARNRAKLQLMLYAFIIKTQNPNARFRNLELLHIRNQWAVDENDAKKNVNVKAFLEVIEGVLKHEKPKLYQALQALPHFKQLFDPTHYVTANKTDFESIHPNADPAMILRLKMLELQSLIMYDQHIALKDDEGTAERKKKISELIAEVMKLRSTSDMSYASWNTDMGWMDKWLGSPSYSTNPYVQLYYQMLSEQKQKARDEYRTWRAKFEILLEKVLKDKRPLTTLIGGINSKDTFSWAYKKIKKGDGYTERFYTSKDAEWNEKLTDAQRELLTFINESVGSMFVDKLSNYVDPRTGKRVALANRIVTYRKVKGKEVGITNLDLFNRSFDRGNFYMKAETFKYYDGFIPKEAPTMSDIIEEHGISGLPQILKFVKHRYLTNYFEANYEGMYSSEEAIPMKGLGSAYIDDNHLYTRNLEFSVDNFMKQSFYKQHLDEVYAYGKAMQIYLEVKASVNQGITFDRTIEWFEESVNLHILGHRQKEVEVSGRTFGRLKDNKYEQFNTIKFLRSVKNFFAGPTMWLKPLTSLPNAVFASLVTLKESIKNSSGLGGANTNFGLTDIAFGFAEAFKLYFWNGLSDRSFRRNKAYLLMEKFGYLPDSYDWYTRPNQLMTAKNRLFTNWAMLRFHSLPEEVISTAIFVAQLKSMKYTKEDGTISNMWDGYTIDKDANSNNEAIGTVKWIGGKRGVRKITNIADEPQYEDLMGLSTEEINSIKFLYEKMHGGYRIDERVSAEYYIMGEFILQLKKYMPSILKNIWASRGLRSTQGYFQEVEENGVKVLKWTPEVIEGRYRILLGMFFNFIGVKNDANGEKGNKLLQWLGYHKDASYDWKTLSKTQKEDMYDFLLTWGMFMILIFGYNNLWDRDDDDTLKKLYGRISNDFAGNVYPLEIVKNVSNLMNPVATRKAYNTIESGTELMWSWMLYSSGYTDEALTREGRFRGSAKFQQNIHFLSAWHDLNSKIDNSEYLSDVLDQYYK